MRPSVFRTLRASALVALIGLIATPVAWANSAPSGVSANEALKRLKDGNARFVAGKPEHPHADAERRTETADKGQHPFATIVACSDSRVPVEAIFDCGIGDVFVIRVAGNVCGVDEVGTIEYGVDHLSTPVLVVMGHSKCGAVTAVATKADLHGNILRLAELIKPAVTAAQKAHTGLHGEALVPEAIKANVWQAIEDTLKSSPDVRELAKAGKVKIIGAVYDLDDGKVDWLGPHPKEEQLLAEAAGSEHPQAHAGAEDATHAGAKPQPASHNPATQPAVKETHAAHPAPAPAATPAPAPVAAPAAEEVTEAARPEQPAPVSVAAQPRDAASSVGLLERCLAEELCRQGSIYLDRAQYATAAERFRAALDIDPSMLAAMNNLAGVYYMQRDYAKAIELYNAVLTRDVGQRSALRGAALVYATQRQYPQSREMLQRLVASNEQDAQAWLDLGDVLYLMSDANGARKHWAKAVEVDRTADQVIARARQRLRVYPPGRSGLTAASPVER